MRAFDFKKFVAVVVVLLVIVVGYIGYRKIVLSKQINLLQASIAVGETVLKVKTASHDLKNLEAKYGSYIDPRVYEKIEYYEASLKAKSDYDIDVDEIYEQYYKTINEPTGEEFEGTPIVEDEGVDIIVEDEMEEVYDERIKIKDGKRVISTSDLNFNDEGVDYILYKNLYIEIRRDNITETYDMMVKNPKYKYKFTTSSIGDGFIDLLFTSMYDESKQIVRVYNDGKKVTDFEVR